MSALLLALTLTLTVTRASNDPPTSEVWYPFLEGGKWGFIDAQGHWKIQPEFDRLFDVFNHDMVRVWLGKKCGYIDRKGAWITKPEFDDLSPYFADATFQVVSHNKKFGILNRQGTVVLPLRYDEVILSSDRAWVREGDRLGVFGFDGQWICPTTLLWPSSRTMPAPLNADQVAWFRENTMPVPLKTDRTAWLLGNRAANVKWGLIDSEGRILIPPRLESHPETGKEPDIWPFQPDGTDFINGKAWVRENGEFELVSKDGTVGLKEPFKTMESWFGDLAVFTDESGKTGLISTAGEIAFSPIDSEIEKPLDGLAKYHVYVHETTPDHDPVIRTLNGYLDSSGKIIVPAGKYRGLGDPSEGLIAAEAYRQYLPNGTFTRPRVAFLDRQGNEVIKLDGCYDAGPFCEGLAAVQDSVDEGPGRVSEGGKWGYIDKTGSFKIHSTFDSASRFCGNLAWVFVETDNNRGNSHALIDHTGKLLTDFRFYPPDSRDPNAEASQLPALRWRGNLALVAGKCLLGLAQRDGRIIVEPRYDQIGSLHDGLMAISTWYKKDKAGLSLGYEAGFLDEKGTEVVPLGTYTAVTDFDRGTAWVTNRPSGGYLDTNETQQKQGWTLIDKLGKTLSAEPYVNARVLYSNYWADAPSFVGDLACVSSVQRSGRNGSMVRANWGYVDRSGHVIAWHKPERN